MVLDGTEESTSVMLDQPQMMTHHHPYPNLLYDMPVTPLVAAPYSALGVRAVEKQVLTFKTCILIPPAPNATSPARRDRPNGCRTVFIGGTPENFTGTEHTTRFWQSL